MWKYASHIQQGISHKRSDTPCQDSVAVQEDEYSIVAAVSDGLGSLENSQYASDTATQTILEIFSTFGAEKLVLNTNEKKAEFGQYLVEEVVERVKQVAAENSMALSTMDCTLAFIYISKPHHYAIIGMLGDSAVCVIRKENSVALNDGNSSANGTNAVLDKTAAQNIKIYLLDMEQQEVQGFILTTDGLSNEIYTKNSLRVQKAAERYINTLCGEAPENALRELVERLTRDENSSFDDDISIAVIGRGEAVVELEADPTWLCTCGARNRLQDTYCTKCHEDFSVLYQNVRFRAHGGKAAFFAEINQDPLEEMRVIGLPVPKPEPFADMPATDLKPCGEIPTTEPVMQQKPEETEQPEGFNTRENYTAPTSGSCQKRKEAPCGDSTYRIKYTTVGDEIVQKEKPKCDKTYAAVKKTVRQIRKTLKPVVKTVGYFVKNFVDNYFKDEEDQP